jgi:DNA-directed RNA polymerase subunit RPC12/RpoP
LAILEEEILVNITSGNVNYYESKGFEIIRVKDKRGIYRYPRGSNLLVKIKDLPMTSGVKLTKICDDCGKYIFNQPYNQILKCRVNGDGKDRCLECGYIKLSNTLKYNIKYEQSLEFCAKKDKKEYLLNEYSIKNIKTAKEIAYKSNDEYIWNCSNCKNEYYMPLVNRTYLNQNCPYCSGKRVMVGFNDLWTVHPEVAKLLNNPQRGYELTSGSGKREVFKCPECGNIGEKIIDNVVKHGFSCSKCSDGISYPEKFVICLLEQLKIDFESQKSFQWSLNKKYDFYISSLNILIETNGMQHYEEGFERYGEKARTVEEEKENDKLKKYLAKENNISNYIIIDCRKSEMNYIKEEILVSNLNEFFDLDKINWNKCDEFACKNLIRKACELWNNKINNIQEIGKILKVCTNTAREYLKKGSKLGWCDYDPRKALKISSSKNGIKSRKMVVQLTKSNEYIKTWSSITEASNILEISLSIISSNCNGKCKSAGGYIWMY